MKTQAFIKGAMLSFVVFFIFSCQNPPQPVNSDLIDFSSMTTTIDAESSIEIIFKKQPELFLGMTEKEKAEAVTINPEVKGKLYLVSKRRLVFQPDVALAPGSEYKVMVHLDKLFNNPGTSIYSYKIKTRPMRVMLTFDNLQPAGTDNSSGDILTGHISTSDPVNIDDLRKNTIANIGKQSLPISIEPDDNSNVYLFTIKNIQRRKDPQKLIVSVNAEQIGGEKKVEASYAIPAISVFSLLNYNVLKKPEPHIELTFSDYLSSDQDLNGLIYFTDGTGVKLSTEQNRVSIYPIKTIEGIHELNLSKSIKNIRGIALNKDYTLKPSFKQIAPQVRFIGKGNILPGKEKWLVPFETVNLSAVDVVVFKIYSNNIKQFLQSNELGDNGYSMNRVGEFIYHEKIILENGVTKPDNKWKSRAIDLTKMIDADPGAIYRVGFRFKKSYAILNCSQTNAEEPSYFDSTSYYYGNYYYPSGYRWNERNDPCKNSFYNYDRFPNRNYFASNIGLTAKKSDDNSYTVYVRNLLTTEAISGAEIGFYSYQNQLLKEVATNKHGEATVKLNKEPFLVVARWNNQYAYLRLKGGSSLSYSKFKTDGVRAQNGIKGYLFGERGVWRPGDTLHLTFVLQDMENTLPDDYPVVLKVKDSRDRQVISRSSTSGTNGFYVFNVPTSQDAPTGIWYARVQIGNSVFTKNLRVETILPNRLKINLKAENERFVAGGSKKLFIESRWLHGGLASKLKATITESISAAKTSFEGYKDFVFNDPAKRFFPEEQTIFEGELDSKGNAVTTIDMPQRKSLPGMLNLTFTAKVFEPGGRFSIEQKNFKYAPFKQYVGIKLPEKENSDYYETGKEQKFEVVTLDENGHKTSVNNLKAEVYKLDWNWWYSSNKSNLANYISQHYLSKIYSTNIKTENGKGSFRFTVNYPDWGRYYVRVTDQKSGNSSGTIIYLDWPSSYSRGNRKAPGDATLLSLSTDKEQYSVGNMATISFPSSANSKALISIEKNNKIIKSWWVETTAKESSFKMEITKEMTPNVYAFVSVIQPHEQTVNDLPIRSYGVIPIMVEDPATLLEPVLEAPKKIKPESEYSIKVSEANKQKMTYVLAVVDEGLLDLTHFRTPSLHDYFYQKEALSVKTWDLYDEVNGAFGARLSGVFAIGGDEELQELGKKKVNRFKPVVTFLGPFTIDKGSNGKTHHLKMDNYIGSVRVMVMAGNSGAYGKADKTIPVKQPLMVLASLPRMLVPGETLDLPVTVFVMEEGIKTVTLNVSGNEVFQIDHPQQTIKFDAPGDKIAYVKLKVNNKTGVGKAHLTVSSGDKSASYDVEISVRNPNKRVYLTKGVAIEKGKSWRGKPEFLKDGSDFKLSASVSSIPPINLEKHVKYLIHYPYGCIEQTTSSVFPQLYLAKLTRLTDNQKLNIENNIRNAIQRLEFFQLPSGGFSYWPGQSGVSDWGTSYAGHFLLLAKEAGYYVPSEMLNSWIAYQQSKANQYTFKNNHYNYDFEQAYRLYTLALAGRPSYSAMNRLRTNGKLTNAAQLRLAAAYAIINEKSIASELVNKAKWGDTDYDDYWYYNYGSYTRNLAMALETYLLTDDKSTAFIIFKDIAEKLGSGNWMSTQTTAYSLYAVSMFVGDNDQQSNFSFNYKFDGKKERIESSMPVYSVELPAEKDKELTVTNKADQTLFLNVETSAIPNPGQVVNKSEGLKLYVEYYDMDGKIIDSKQLPQGKDFYVRISVLKTAQRKLRNLALTAIFPSGWEILNTRMVDVGGGLESSASDFQDIRDDRVNLFFDLNHNESKTFYILLNAAYPGNYYRAPVSCKAMYDNSINATNGGGMVEVSR